ncbi:MAG: DNA ligase D, partial [Solirubrobacteraceae bacterium]
PTEDHPLQYLDFEGEIPAGEYGAGTIRIWDRGTFETHKWSEDKIEVTFHGERLRGRYGMFPIGGERDWMIHRMDPPTDAAREPMPERIVPMLAVAGQLPRDQARWSFEVKWDGVRAIAYVRPGRLRLESRNLNEITATYPEVRGLLRDLGMREAVLDGELVAFDEDGRPSFERLQRRMHVTSEAAVRRLSASTPVVYAIFDLLHLDGHSLIELPYERRRERLQALGLGGPAWRVPSAHSGGGGGGAKLLEATAARMLEGVVAKRLDSRYEPGRRSGAWVKIKHTLRQELVIAGWLPGEGRRDTRIGSLLMGDWSAAGGETAGLRYAGRVGTGFTERTLDDLKRRLTPLQRQTSPFAASPRLPRGAVFVEPELVAEIEFREWTSDGVMRAPSFKGLRDDKPAVEVVREPPPAEPASAKPGPAAPEQLFDDVRRLPDGSLSVLVDDRALKLSNWDKVLFPETGFTKGDLIAYYVRVAPALLPHLRDRPLTLKRYPNGVREPYFYEKQSPSHRPPWVQTARIGGVTYTLAQDRPTLVWLANLADIELHTSLSLAAAPQRPTMAVFDLDPGDGADLVKCAEVALVLRGLFAGVGLESVAKTSGSKGIQVYVPLNRRDTTYEQTKSFARAVAQLLEQRLPELVVSRMTKSLRADRVLVDYSQNDAHKTTANVYSVRARERPTVSTPVCWEELRACLDEGDAARVVFETADALARIEHDGDRFAAVLHVSQALPRLH